MKERPILFNGEMVRAVLDGRKTVTRRVLKPQPELVEIENGEMRGQNGWSCERFWRWNGERCTPEGVYARCPYGAPGDRLWVRETHYRFPVAHTPMEMCRVLYEANGAPTLDEHHDLGLMKKYPSIHMPRWASRITLEVKSVRVERVQEITDADSLAEGIKPSDVAARGYQDARVAFRVLWNSINEKRGFGWDSNPWVWVVEFERVD
jgi:hypothetical protein